MARLSVRGFMPVSIISLMCLIFLAGCGFFKDARQLTVMTKEFKEKGRIITAERDKIRRDALNVKVDDGISRDEAEALVGDYLLDKYPQFGGWSVEVFEDGELWKADCHFAGEDQTIFVNKKTGALKDPEFKIEFVHIPK